MEEVGVVLYLDYKFKVLFCIIVFFVCVNFKIDLYIYVFYNFWINGFLYNVIKFFLFKIIFLNLVKIKILEKKFSYMIV